jgi:hypothetical protein
MSIRITMRIMQEFRHTAFLPLYQQAAVPAALKLSQAGVQPAAGHSSAKVFARKPCDNYTTADPCCQPKYRCFRKKMQEP